MALPSTQKKWIIMGREKGLDDLQLVEGPIPKVDDYEVLVKLHAASINPREVQIMNVRYMVHPQTFQNSPVDSFKLNSIADYEHTESIRIQLQAARCRRFRWCW